MRDMITQQDGMGCGAACVAFATHKTYQQTAELLGQEKARTVGFHLKELVTALREAGLEYQFKHVKPKLQPRIYQEGVIIFIKRSAKYPYGHYLIRHNGLWGDPWINLVLNKDLSKAKSGYRSRLPGKAQWALFPTKTSRKPIARYR